MGAIVVVLDVARLSELVSGTTSFITDANGVILLASNRDWEMRALESAHVHAMTAEARQALYQRADFQALSVQPLRNPRHPRLAGVNGEPVPYVIAHAGVPGSGLGVNVLASMTEFETIEAEARRTFASLAALAVVLFLLVCGSARYLHRIQAHRAELRRMNAELNGLNARLHLEATTDALTGCVNRRRFMQMLDTECARVRRHGGALSLLMADIDHFKRINDTHGHAVGDLALKHLAAVAARLLRHEDVFARIGGEEFVFLLPQTTLNGALAFAERVRAAIQAEPLAGAAGPIAFTVSIGAATSGGAADSGSALLERADRALYAAKRSGRNRVEAAAERLAA